MSALRRAQTRRGSLVEAGVNTALGLAVNFALNLTLLPAVGCALTAGQAAGLTLIFTLVSIARSFCVRRVAEALLRRNPIWPPS